MAQVQNFSEVRDRSMKGNLLPIEYSPNPYYADVEVWVKTPSNEKIMLSMMKGEEPRPQYVKEFSYSTFAGDDIANRATFTFIDEEWDYIEGLLAGHNNSGAYMYFNFGYTTPEGSPLRSPTYQCKVKSLSTSFGIDHVELRVETFSCILQGEGGEKEVNMSWGPETVCDWPEGRPNKEGTIVKGEPIPEGGRIYPKLGMTASQILQELAWKNSYWPDIEPTLEILVEDDLEGTEEVNKIFNQARQSDLNFIKNTLLPLCVSKTNKSGYTIAFSDFAAPNQTSEMPSPKETEHVMSVRPIAIGAKAKFEYVFMREKMSSVISFSAAVVSPLVIPLGAQEMAAASVNQVTDEKGASVQSDITTAEKEIMDRMTFLFDGSQNANVWTKSMIKPFYNAREAWAVSYQRFISMFNRQMTGVLVIVGHPPGKERESFLEGYGPMAGDVIRVLNPKPNGMLHYSSGLYYIKEMTHTITSGSFTTTMQLWKNTIREPEFGGEGTTPAHGETPPDLGGEGPQQQQPTATFVPAEARLPPG
jgi:hypothetical protein